MEFLVLSIISVSVVCRVSMYQMYQLLRLIKYFASSDSVTPYGQSINPHVYRKPDVVSSSLIVSLVPFSRIILNH